MDYPRKEISGYCPFYNKYPSKKSCDYLILQTMIGIALGISPPRRKRVGLSTRTKDGKRQEEDDQLHATVQRRTDEVVVFVVDVRMATAKPDLREETHGDRRPNPTRAANVILSRVRRNDSSVDKNVAETRDELDESPVQDRKGESDDQTQRHDEVAAIDPVDLFRQCPGDSLGVESLHTRTTPHMSSDGVQEDLTLGGHDRCHDRVVETGTEEGGIDLREEHDSVRYLKRI